MQVVYRPFDDATVLRVAHAYEKATPWRTKRPRLDPDAEFSTVLPSVPDPEPAQIDAATRDRVAVACRPAGLTLSDRQFEMACAGAPYVIAIPIVSTATAPTARNPPTSYTFFHTLSG
jgi:aspartyl-tRNA(Asn)/glutamyl-tRNA(Gln) amidotransferase subunit A